jgi:4,5-dihydroxyphthalate decarboxylase
MALKLRMTCGLYDRTLPLIDGTVKPDGIDLEITVNSDDRSRQRAAREGEFDVAEFFAGIYIADLEYKSLDLTAVPIFVKRMFRHSYIYVNKRSGIRSASELNGRRIGVQTWLTTTPLWARGILEEDFGVDLGSITWVAQWQASVADWKPPSWTKLEFTPAGVKLYDLLLSGDVDAVITTENWAPFGDPSVDFLFPNYAALEREYFSRTGFFPIHHLLVIRSSVLAKEPWVAMSLFNAWQTSKEHCYKWLERQRAHLTSLWFRALWEEERKLAGPDFYVWGFKKSRAEVDKMLEFAQRQGFTTKRFKPEDMFHPSTLET